jgi:hypothetical protein
MMHERPSSALLTLLAGLLLVHGCDRSKPVGPAAEPGSTKLPVAIDEKTPKADAEKTPVESPKADRPAYTMTAIGITEEFVKDRVAAEKKYKDKLLEVEGTVSTASQNKVRQTGSVVLSGYKEKRDDPLPRQVVCVVKQPLAGRVGLLGKGQKVRVKGRFHNHDAVAVTLTDAEYEELTPSSVPRLTAEALAQEFSDNKEAAAKKYGDKDVIVEGIVVDLVEKDGQCSVKLAGTDNVRVSCTTLFEDEFKTLKKFAKVRLKGEVSLFDSRELIINSAFLVN